MKILPPLQPTGLYTSKINQETPALAKSFGDYLSDAVSTTAKMGQHAENQALQGIAGQGDLVTTMTALEELGLTVKIVMEFHKKAVQMYKDISQTGL